MDPSNEQSPPAQSAKSPRLLSLDVFRGLTILAMILVNNPGSWGHMYWPLGHASWHGWTPTDLIFPFFLFIVGTSLAYSLRKYRDGEHISPAVYWRIVRRTLVLLALGLLLNRSAHLFNLMLGNIDSFEFDTWRFPGVLQRIALVYFAASLIVLHLNLRLQVIVAAVLLLGYWGLMAWFPGDNYQENLSPEGNIVRVVDRAVFSDGHLWTQGKTEKTDPEGLVSTLPAIVTAMLGYWVGLFIQRRGVNVSTVMWLIGIGAALVLLGLVWHWGFPINKKIWTSSFVVLTAGWAMIVLAGCLLKFDIWGWRRFARPFEIVGINAIFVFVASGMMAQLLASVTKVGDVSTKQWLYDTLFTSWITTPELASLGFALMTVTFWWLVLWGMARLGWSVRV